MRARPASWRGDCSWRRGEKEEVLTVAEAVAVASLLELLARPALRPELLAPALPALGELALPAPLL